MIVIILVFMVLATLYIINLQKNRKYDEIMEKIPGPKPIPIIGNALEFGSNIAEILSNSIRLGKEYGSFYRLWIGSRLVIVISDPDKLGQILSSNKNIKKSTGYDGFRPWLGEGLITSHSEKWRKHRKILTPAFHFSILTQFGSNINSNLNILISNLSKTTDKPSTDVLHHLGMFALDVLSETAMKTKIGALENNDNIYVTAVKNYMNIFISRFFSFYKQNMTLFKLTPGYSKLMYNVKILHEVSRNVIRKRIKERENSSHKIPTNDDFGVKTKKYFIDILLDLKDKGELSEQDVAEEVDTFMFAGHDTISTTVAFALLLLGEHQDVQKKVFDESNEVLRKDPGYDLDYQDVQKLQYLDMFAKEAMRFYPTIPFIEREITDEIEIDGIKIPVGTTLHLFIWNLHYDPEYFPNPEKFDPERFLSENIRTRHPFAYLPFSAGPRNCIGQRYAMMTTKMTIVKIVRNFMINPAPNFKPIIGTHGVLTSMNGVHVKLEKRIFS